jgi:hypothetical protein
MAYSIPNISAVIPEIIAPIAYPKSLHNLKHQCFLLFEGLVAPAIVDKSWIKKAVPKPKSPETNAN